jgi:hypothetical protein
VLEEELLGQAEHQRQGVLGDRDGVGAAGVGHLDAATLEGAEIELVAPGVKPHERAEPGGRVQDAGREHPAHHGVRVGRVLRQVLVVRLEPREMGPLGGSDHARARRQRRLHGPQLVGSRVPRQEHLPGTSASRHVGLLP